MNPRLVRPRHPCYHYTTSPIWSPRRPRTHAVRPPGLHRLSLVRPPYGVGGKWSGCKESNLDGLRVRQLNNRYSSSRWWRWMESNHRCLPLGCLIYSQVGSPLPNTSVEGQVGIAPTSNWVTASPLSIWVLPRVVVGVGIEPTLFGLSVQCFTN